MEFVLTSCLLKVYLIKNWNEQMAMQPKHSSYKYVSVVIRHHYKIPSIIWLQTYFRDFPSLLLFKYQTFQCWARGLKCTGEELDIFISSFSAKSTTRLATLYVRPSGALLYSAQHKHTAHTHTSTSSSTKSKSCSCLIEYSLLRQILNNLFIFSLFAQYLNSPS